MIKRDKVVGIVIVTHGALGEELLRVAEYIMGKKENAVAVSTGPDKPPEKIKEDIKRAIEKVDSGDGVLILTDMFGGTPSNISLSFLKKGNVEVVTGVNLPMVLKLMTIKEKKDLRELADYIRDYGQKNISIASEVLKIKK